MREVEDHQRIHVEVVGTREGRVKVQADRATVYALLLSLPWRLHWWRLPLVVGLGQAFAMPAAHVLLRAGAPKADLWLHRGHSGRILPSWLNLGTGSLVLNKKPPGD